MAQFCVRISERFPSEELVIEAETAEKAMALRALDLAEWADMVKLEAWLVIKLQKDGGTI